MPLILGFSQPSVKCTMHEISSATPSALKHSVISPHYAAHALAPGLAQLFCKWQPMEEILKEERD
ncbi:hypothetical protein BDZ91DRAFT_735787 [Kalaharituber pfeilii]|nr:hypothetical protein BDZ91DRAFT_735787 [Kalaharituber pfeilii]